MNPWLLREIDDLQAKIDRLGSPRELSRELDSIRQEANRIAGASFLDGPALPLFHGIDELKQRLGRLQDKLDNK